MQQRHRLVVGNRPGEVDRRAVEIRGDPAGADAFADRVAAGDQFAGVDVAGQRRAFRVGQRDAHAGVACLQRATDAGQGAAGARGADEAVDAAAGVVPDLRAGGGFVPVAVGGVVELVGEPRAARIGGIRRLGVGARLVRVVVRVLVRHRGHQPHFGAGDAQRVDLLAALRLRHEDHRAIAAAGAEQGQPDPGVAGGALDDAAAGADQPASLGIQQQAQRGAVLDRAAGVEELGLAEDLAAGQRGGVAQAQQRRVADGGGEVGLDAHRGR